MSPQAATAGRAAEAPDIAIETVGLVKTFGDTRAVDGVDLIVPTGTVYGSSGRTAPARRPP